MASRTRALAAVLATIRSKRARLKRLEQEVRRMRAELRAVRNSVDGRLARPGGARRRHSVHRPAWPSSVAGRAALALRRAGKPMRVEALLESLARAGGPRISQPTLVGQLARDARKGRIFRRTAPNVYGLAEWRRR